MSNYCVTFRIPDELEEVEFPPDPQSVMADGEFDRLSDDFIERYQPI